MSSTMKKALLVIAFLLTTTSVQAQQSTTQPSGQVITWKQFHPASTNFNKPAGKGLFTTTEPANPAFTKRYADTFVECFAMFDTMPTTTATLMMAITIYDANYLNVMGRIEQFLSSNPPGEITFAFGDLAYELPVGTYQIVVQMQTADGSKAFFQATEANLECKEEALPNMQP